MDASYFDNFITKDGTFIVEQFIEHSKENYPDGIQGVDNMAFNEGSKFYNETTITERFFIGSGKNLVLTRAPSVRELIHWCFVADTARTLNVAYKAGKHKDDDFVVGFCHDIIEDGYMSLDDFTKLYASTDPFDNYIVSHVVKFTDIVEIDLCGIKNLKLDNRQAIKLASYPSLLNTDGSSSTAKIADRLHNIIRCIRILNSSDPALVQKGIKYSTNYVIEDLLFRKVMSNSGISNIVPIYGDLTNNMTGQSYRDIMDELKTTLALRLPYD